MPAVPARQHYALTDLIGLLSAGVPIKSAQLFDIADLHFGGTQAAGTYTAADAYDLAETALHAMILQRRSAFSPTVGLLPAQVRADDLEDLAALLPTRTRRDDEVVAFDQFSTPPHLGFVCAWLCDLNHFDVVLEPSAGTGGLAVHARNAGAVVVCNELSERRRAALAALGFTSRGENADHLHSVLPATLTPSVVLMNPPFSATAGRMGEQTDPMTAARHVDQCLKRLAASGRLVAVLPSGMGFGAARYRDWWRAVWQRHTIRANVTLDGRAFKKAGTGIPVRVVVIDKTGPTPEGRRPVVADVDSASALMAVLEPVRLNRPRPQRAEPPVLVPPSLPESPGSRPAVEPPRHGTAAAEAPPSPGTISGGEPASPAAASKASPSPSPAPAPRSTDAFVTVTGQAPIVPVADAPTVEVAHAKIQERHAAPLQDTKYEPYKPQRLDVPGAHPHPGKLVESAAMAVVLPPVPTYAPHFPERVITDGLLSLAQLEAVIAAGQSHQQFLPAAKGVIRARMGFAIGDGTGVGKGREASGIILDNWCQDRTKALWVTKNDTTLLGAAKRDWSDLGGDPNVIFPLSKIPAGEPIKATTGILLASVGTLRSKPRDKKTRLQQILDWLGPDFDGVIISDEHHAAANAVDTDGARGKVKASQTGLASVDLQKALPLARVVYISATLADKVDNLSSCERLGLWGYGTAFSSKEEFITQIQAGGIAAMEIVTRDLKAMGRYLARSLSYEDIRYQRLVHDLTPDQVALYDEMAAAWRIVLHNLRSAADAVGISSDPQAMSKIMSAFWGSHQGFFNQVLSAFLMPSVIKSMEADIAAGHAPLVYFVNTGEAAQERALSREGAEENLDDLDMTPRERLSQYLEMCFPVKQHEPYVDEAGNERTRPAVDSEGKPILNAEALEMRDELLARIGELKVPHAPLEQILDHFGPEMVAELTGRSRRVVSRADAAGIHKKVIEPRSKAHVMADLAAFQDDRKRIAVLSNAGNTGIDLHAGLKLPNQRLRRFYIVQAGWSAKEATQACGRPHRSNQKQAPEIVLCTTSLRGHKRFITSIARRLGQLGALTKGQRSTGEQGIFSEKDNLEGEHGSAAVFQLIMDLYCGKEVGGLTMDGFCDQLGLKLIDPRDGALLLKKIPTVRQFLNRLLSMDVEPQNRMFDEFASRLDQLVETAMEAGTLNVGMETIIADSIEAVSEPRVVYTHPSGAETVYTELKVWKRNHPLSFDDLREKHGDILHFVTNRTTQRLYALRPAHNRTGEDGKVVGQYRLVGPLHSHYVDVKHIDGQGPSYHRVSWDKAKKLWVSEVAAAEPFTIEAMHVVSGVLLPIWHHLADTESTKVYRMQTNDGRRILGRVVPATKIRQVLAKLGSGYGSGWSPKEAIDAVIAGETLTLANGWTLKRALVSREHRVELTGCSNMQFVADLVKIGVRREMISSATRYFVPHSSTKVMALLIEHRPVADGAVARR